MGTKKMGQSTNDTKRNKVSDCIKLMNILELI